MRLLLLGFATFAIIALSGACDQSSAIVQPAVAGLPATDHDWRTSDFEAAAAALTNATPLPHRSDAGMAPVFARLTDPALLAVYADRSVPLSNRLQDCLAMAGASGQIFRLYVMAEQRDLSYADDAMAIMGFILQSGAAMSNLMDEFIPTLDPTDPTYATRMQGVDRTRRGLLQILQGSVTTLTIDRNVYSDAETARFAAILAQTFPSLARDLSPDAVASFRHSLGQIARTDRSADVRAALVSFNAVSGN